MTFRIYDHIQFQTGVVTITCTITRLVTLVWFSHVLKS
jgi:hypothetical protein